MNNESLYYNVRVKGHLEEKWTELYTNNRPDLPILKGTVPIQSDSQTTVLYYSISGYPQNNEVDFQVIAMYGDYTTSEPASHDPFVPSFTSFGILADGESGWSSTQTVTVPANTPSIPTPTLSPSNTSSSSFLGNPLIIAIPLVVIIFLLVVIIFLLVYIRRQRTT